MSARLIDLNGQPSDLREILINKEEFLIGRGADCDLRLNASLISRHHCLLRRSGEEYILLDLGSSNGTYLNGQRLISQHKLQSGDQISVGAFHFQLDLQDRDGIDWCKSQKTRPEDRTIKLSQLKQEIQLAREQSQPVTPHGPTDSEKTERESS